MRKLGRMARRVLTAVSLLLFVAVLAAWTNRNGGGVWVQRESIDGVQWRRQALSVRETHQRLLLVGSLERAEADGMPPGVMWSYSSKPEYPPRWAGRTPASLVAFHEWGERLAFPGVEVEFDARRQRLDDRIYDTGTMYAFIRDVRVEVPCWMAAIVFGALPSWRCFVWWRGVRRRRLASREGRCGVCGYDLRASPQRCPECGTAVGGKGE